MQIPKREKKTKKEILESIGACAKQYVPEWRYDPENPDAGSALVSLFADMMCENIRRFNLSLTGDLFSFFDEIHAKMLPAQPAEGFFTFTLPDGVEEAEAVPKGTRILADGETGPVVFETQEEVLVRPMELQKIYLSKPKEDGLYQVFDREREEMPSFFLFQNQGENLERHRIFFCFSGGLEIETQAEAKLALTLTGRGVEAAQWEQVIREGKKIRFSYGTAEGYRDCLPVRSVLNTESPDGYTLPDAEHPPVRGTSNVGCPGGYDYRDGVLHFSIKGGEDGIAKKEEWKSSYVVQAEIFDAGLFSEISLLDLSLSVRGKNRKPDFIHVNGTDQEMEDFLLFGRTPAIYDTCYIGSEEVLGKRGAQICLEFDLDFVRLPLEIVFEEKIAWKTVMKKRELVPEMEYDITIHEVIWEYYNGYGWTRLPVDGKYRKIFAAGAESRGQRVHMEFHCPLDMQPVLVHSVETCTIRARVLRMENAYKTKGTYVAPVAGRVCLSYDYQSAPLRPFEIVKENHLETKRISREEMEQAGFATSFCERNPDPHAACYLGFARPPVEGPLQFLFVLQDAMQRELPGPVWEYLGEDGWRQIHPIDGTKGFHHTGIVSWYGRTDIRRSVLFGQDLFWIRLLDVEEGYGSQEALSQCPKIQGIYPNSARILGRETIEETHGIPPYAEEKQIPLSYTEVGETAVWVLERQEEGQDALSTMWVPWKEAEELNARSGERREFAVDRQNGTVLFPKYMDRAFWREPGEIAVRIRYAHCQGAQGNQRAGAIRRLDQSIGFINGGYNPTPTTGGCPPEPLPEAVRRNARALRHGYRCISAGDYEDMAREAARNIRKVKCFSGYDRTGKRAPGYVTLVILPAAYEEDGSDFERTRMQVYEYLSARMDGNLLHLGKFQIMKPEMVRIDVSTVLELTAGREVFQTRKNVQAELERFLHPLWGNVYGEGWEIGTIPGQEQISHALKRVEGVKHIRQIHVRKFCAERFGEREILEESDLPFYRLPESGMYEIQIEL
ncbi:MAG: hypothetical protein HFH24_02190 [Ruminococcus sp.]|mgnify:CR=1 FL=1|nr:hypothetical protein [Ruminococcus sp.]